MASQAVKQRNTISLRGSAQIVAEFFNYAVNSILYQRGIYPQETFQQKKNYGLAMMVTKDDGLLAYLTNVTKQMTDWLEKGLLQRLVLVVTSAFTGEVLERWTFEVQTDEATLNGGAAPEKPEKEITAEIQAIIRQITASITFLPLLEDPCTFDLLVYTDTKSSVPDEWEESDPRYITNATDVKLRSFTTKVHKVDTVVSYRLADA
ncbi:Mitotic spindle assembly checkpoint protein MAD2A [Monoraphidium neglectum]|uniref:Mitotic spindle assembly checkpoint protein MAD2A n=1 Tax=Monoraphidium neglectum TaxID=145388 RepID=A0A0D2MU67_9CHLO|nr:Mitotic spindle assembly checkpoint protein MAD2A [Monoraphidium neglectum]KIY97980.1 Mitotic spindle assembly checkpoint protein MAD2A [Monoraphidium neglectum]|eukprot:XP_013897000.1 Mitotic spindle assembly checkpoint protein MAD2A [Monoraphidium neglectum]